VWSYPGAIECLAKRLWPQQQQQQAASVEGFRTAEMAARCLGFLAKNFLIRQSIVTQQPQVMTRLQELAQQQQQQQQGEVSGSSTGGVFGSGRGSLLASLNRQQPAVLHAAAAAAASRAEWALQQLRK
jgi:hypothetical protein